MSAKRTIKQLVIESTRAQSDIEYASDLIKKAVDLNLEAVKTLNGEDETRNDEIQDILNTLHSLIG